MLSGVLVNYCNIRLNRHYPANELVRELVALNNVLLRSRVATQKSECYKDVTAEKRVLRGGMKFGRKS